MLRNAESFRLWRKSVMAKRNMEKKLDTTYECVFLIWKISVVFFFWTAERAMRSANLPFMRVHPSYEYLNVCEYVHIAISVGIPSERRVRVFAHLVSINCIARRASKGYCEKHCEHRSFRNEGREKWSRGEQGREKGKMHFMAKKSMHTCIAGRECHEQSWIRFVSSGPVSRVHWLYSIRPLHNSISRMSRTERDITFRYRSLHFCMDNAHAPRCWYFQTHLHLIHTTESIWSKFR